MSVVTLSEFHQACQALSNSHGKIKHKNILKDV
jgi:hypothetical protein